MAPPILIFRKDQNQEYRNISQVKCFIDSKMYAACIGVQYNCNATKKDKSTSKSTVPNLNYPISHKSLNNTVV